MEILFDNDYLKAQTVPIPFTILCTWKGYWAEVIAGGALEEALNFPLQYAQKHQLITVISDCSVLETVSLEVQDYIAAQWYPTAFQVGIKAEILVDAQDFMGKLAVDFFIDLNNSSVDTPKVESIAQAYLLAQKFVEAFR